MIWLVIGVTIVVIVGCIYLQVLLEEDHEPKVKRLQYEEWDKKGRKKKRVT